MAVSKITNTVTDLHPHFGHLQYLYQRVLEWRLCTISILIWAELTPLYRFWNIHLVLSFSCFKIFLIPVIYSKSVVCSTLSDGVYLQGACNSSLAIRSTPSFNALVAVDFLLSICGRNLFESRTHSQEAKSKPYIRELSTNLGCRWHSLLANCFGHPILRVGIRWS